MPWNEEIRATWARMERLAASPAAFALVMPLVTEVDVRAVLPTVRVPNPRRAAHRRPFILPEWGKYVADHISGAKYVELPGRNMYHFVEPWRPSFQEISQLLTGHQAEVADDRVLATVLFTVIHVSIVSPLVRHVCHIASDPSSRRRRSRPRLRSRSAPLLIPG
jgi:hypothetical protein